MTTLGSDHRGSDNQEPQSSDHKESGSALPAVPLRPAPPQETSLQEDMLRIFSPEEHIGPAVSEHLTLSDFMAKAIECPRLLRNNPQYLADAIAAYGKSEVNCFGRKLPHFHSTEAEWLPSGVKDKQIPRGLHETLWEIHSKLSEWGQFSHAKKGILLRSMPGCGKETLLNRIFDILVDYSSCHPEGVRYRLAFRFPNEREAKRVIGFTGTRDKNSESNNDFVISSPSNVNPIFALPCRGGSFGNRTPSLRERFVAQLLDNADESVNQDFLYDDYLDPTSQAILNALERYYDGDISKAITEHVIAERYEYDPSLAEGVYTKLPFSDPESVARTLEADHPLRGSYVPQQLHATARNIPILQSPLLTDFILCEDLFSSNPRDRGPADVSRHGHLLAFLERGLLQIEGQKLVRVKSDVVVLASTNNSQLESKVQSDTWEPLQKRFFCLAVPGIRQYQEEVTAHQENFSTSLGSDIGISPHALSTLCLFAVATRMLKPRPEYYQGVSTVTNEKVGEVVGKLNEVRKALLFQAPEHKERDSDLNCVAKWASLSSDDIALLRENEWAIAHEYLADLHRFRPGVYDGGFGISTRDVAEYLSKVKEKCADKGYVSSLDIVSILREANDNGFEYYLDFHELKSDRLVQLYKKLCADSDVQPVDPNVLHSNGNEESLSQQRKLFEEASQIISERFPISSPANLIDDVSEVTRYRIERDFRSVLMPSDIPSVVVKYLYHVRARLLKDSLKVPDDYRVATVEETNVSYNVDFMKEIESLVLGGPKSESKHDEFRQDFYEKFNAWKTKNFGNVAIAELSDELLQFDKAELLADKVRQNKESTEAKDLHEFWQASERYYTEGKLPENPEEKTTHDEWLKHWKALENLGYHPESITEHFHFAFRDLIRKHGKTI